MPRVHFLAVLFSGFLTAGFFPFLHGQAPATTGRSSVVDLVHPMIGTAAEGQTFPGAGVPFAMTMWTPQTRAGENKCVAPYYAADTRLQGFRGTHFLSGSCTQDYGSMTLMPLLDPAHVRAEERSIPFTHAAEVSHPYLYSVDMTATGIHADITGLERSGMMRFRFPPGTRTGWIALENNVRLGTGTVAVDPARGEVTVSNPVHRIYAGNGKPAGFSGYFVVQFSRPLHLGGIWAGSTALLRASQAPAVPGPQGAVVGFDLRQAAGIEDGVVLARIGTSFVSLDEARRNLSEEIPAGRSFHSVVDEAREKWDTALSAVTFAGSPARQSIFYTALYHAMQLPRIASDRSGSYPRFAGAGAVAKAEGFTYYDDYSLWDTFRAVHPLFTILDPGRELDMVKSLLAKGEEGGFLPIFPAWGSYTSEMVGDHADAVITDAYAKGIRGFDAERAYALMRRNATELPRDRALYLDGRGRRGLDSYLKYGYIPLANNIRIFQSQFGNIRADGFNDWDVSVLKNFNFTEHAFLQYRFEAFNVNNRPVFAAPNVTSTATAFGQITGTANSPRTIQMAARLVF